MQPARPFARRFVALTATQDVDDAADHAHRIVARLGVQPGGPVTGQTSTHLPHRVQASTMVSTRPCRADFECLGHARP